MFAARLVAFAFLPCVLSAQDPATQSPAPRRPRWQSTLDLPKDLWRDVTAETIGTTAEWTNKF